MTDKVVRIDGSLPIKLAPTRSWRTYVGGKLIDELHGEEHPKDSQFPEEWLMSIVSARISGREHITDEGLSKVALPDVDLSLKSLLEKNPNLFLGEEHFMKFGKQTGVLVKLIDSAERLTIQTHPDRERAQKFFQSSFGKTECWHFLGGREIEGEAPHVYLGFRPGVTRKQWEKHFYNQDISSMLECMHKFYVQPGDTFLVEAGTPHAIGSGCLLVEIQEPTDYTIRLEKTSQSGLIIDDFMMHQGLGFEKMFEFFNYKTYTREETLEKWFISPSLLRGSEGNKEIELVGYQNTPYFKMTKVEVTNELEVKSEGVFSGLFILSGNASILVNGECEEGKIGDHFFIPATVSSYIIQNNGEEVVKALRLFGPTAK